MTILGLAILGFFLLGYVSIVWRWAASLRTGRLEPMSSAFETAGWKPVLRSEKPAVFWYLLIIQGVALLVPAAILILGLASRAWENV